MHFVFCQISNKLINGNGETIADQYYESLYANKEKDGYYRPEHFWELPLWIGEATYALQGEHDCSLHVVTDVNEPLPDLGKPSEMVYCFSVLDVNRSIVLDIIRNNLDKAFEVGGYVDGSRFVLDLDATLGLDEDFVYDVGWHESIAEFCDTYDVGYKYGVDWSLFAGVRTIPRLTMSYKVEIVRDSAIRQQVLAMKDLKFRLVYLNDKTFGQCQNADSLDYWFRTIKSYNSDFRGFVVQTTCAEVIKRPVKFWSDNHIVVVELGIETFNDNLLKKYNKPQNERTIARAVDKLHRVNVNIIANIILGFPGETMRSYGKTLSFLYYFPFYALNTSLYQGTSLANEIDKVNADDSNELAETRSFWTPQEKADFNSVSPLFYHLGIDKVTSWQTSEI